MNTFFVECVQMILFKRLFLVFFFASCAELASAETEIHALGIYEGYVDELSSFEGGFARVIVDRPEAVVVLSLNSLKPVRWIIEATPDTKVENILLHGADPTASEVFLNGVDFSPQVVDDFGFAWVDEGKPFRGIITDLTSMFEVASIASFQGAYKAGRDAFTINATESGPKLRNDYPKRLNRPGSVPKDLVGPLNQAEMADKPLVELTYDGFVVRENKDETLIPIAKDLPQLNHPSAAAFDKTGRRLFGVTYSGEGFIYQYNLSDEQWSYIDSELKRNAVGVLFDEKQNRLIIGIGGHRAGISVYDLSSGKKSKLPLRTKDLVAFKDLYDPDNESVAHLKPIAVAKGALLVRAEADKRFHPDSTASRTYLIDMLSGEATLVAYENEE